MRDVAAEFGVSDVGLKKICVRHDIEPPRQGHWQRIARGEKIPTPSLTAGRPDQTIDVYGADPVREPDLPTEERFRLDSLLERESRSEYRIQVPTEPAPFHSVTKRIQKVLKASKPDDYGCLRCCEADLPFVRVTPQTLPRALILVDSIVRAVDRRGFSWRAGSGQRWEPSDLLEIEGIAFGFEVFETVQRRHHRLTPEEKLKDHYWAPKYDFVSTNQLSIRRSDYDVYLKDTERLRVEDRLNELMIILINRAFKEREEKRRRDIRAAEEAARAAKRAEIEKLKRVESAALERLLKNAVNWKKAQDLRAFIAAVEALSVADDSPSEQRDRWLRWARIQAEVLDPLSAELRSVVDLDFEALERLDALIRS